MSESVDSKNFGELGNSPDTTLENSLLIRHGLIATAERQWSGDIRVWDDKIVEVGENLLQSERQECIIDADGMQVIPGGIDPHTHLMRPWVDDYLSGSQSAIAGGITTIGCMVYGEENVGLLDVVNEQTKLVREQSIVDIFLHPNVWTAIDKVQEELPEMVKSGHTSIKIFMVSPRFVDNEERYVDIIHEAGRVGLITLLHCEDAQALQMESLKLGLAGHTSLRYYAESRPVSSEVSAVKKAIAICEKTSAPVYLVHISSKEALDACYQARKNGLPVYVETRPIYLYFTRERYLEPDGPLYVGQPPLRDIVDVNALWDGLAQGIVDTLGSDHAPWSRDEKMHPSLNIHDLRPGVADLQTMLPIFYSEGVMKNKISLERFVALTSTNAAKLFGLFPQKGTIAVGSDADLVLWNPTRKCILRKDDLFSRSGFSLHEGWEINGYPEMTIRRGRIVYKSGKIVGKPGSGILPVRSRPVPSSGLLYTD